MSKLPSRLERAACRSRSIGWRLVLTLVARKFVISGDRSPGEPCVIVANHSSHADTPALLAALGSTAYPLAVAAHDYWFVNPLRRVFFQCVVGGYPVRRSGGGYGDLLRAQSVFRRKRSLIMFPEGTRRNGDDLGRFHNGPFRFAREVGVPVLPVAIVGTSKLLRAHRYFPRRARIEVRIGTMLHNPTTSEARSAIAALLTLEDSPH